MKLKPVRMCFSFDFQMLFNLPTELVFIAQNRTCGKNLANLFQRKRCLSYKKRKSEYHGIWKWRKTERRDHFEKKEKEPSLLSGINGKYNMISKINLSFLRNYHDRQLYSLSHLKCKVFVYLHNMGKTKEILKKL